MLPCELGLILLTASGVHRVSLEGTYYAFVFASLFANKIRLMILALWFLINRINRGERVKYRARQQ